MAKTATPEEREAEHWRRLSEIVARQRFGLPEVLRFFPAYTRRREFPRLLAHYELFKQIVDLPGGIVELGVYVGSTFFTWAKLLETFCPGDRSRKVYGFDHFAGLTGFVEKDGKPDPGRDKYESCYRFDGQTVMDLVDLHNDDNLLPGVERCRVIDGDLRQTVPQFIADHPGFRISLLHLDVDLYEPTRAALELLYPLVVQGGLIVFDEYALPPWEGETRAADEFLARLPARPTLKKFPFSSQPSGWFVKQE
jgi:hypothetical protein